MRRSEREAEYRATLAAEPGLKRAGLARRVGGQRPRCDGRALREFARRRTSWATLGAMSRVIIVGNVSEDPFAIDVGHSFGQETDLSDIVSLKNFANGEFCPRFISDEHDLTRVGHQLEGATVVIVSVDSHNQSRQTLAQRNFLIARAAKDNGASKVILVEPDLFYSAQDRGPRPEHGNTAHPRDVKDHKKFDGQPFSSLLYAQLLKTAGVDAVITVHNHSRSVQEVFRATFGGDFANLTPSELYAHYLTTSDMVETGEARRQSGLVRTGQGRGRVRRDDAQGAGLAGREAVPARQGAHGRTPSRDPRRRRLAGSAGWPGRQGRHRASTTWSVRARPS